VFYNQIYELSCIAYAKLTWEKMHVHNSYKNMHVHGPAVFLRQQLTAIELKQCYGSTRHYHVNHLQQLKKYLEHYFAMQINTKKTTKMCA